MSIVTKDEPLEPGKKKVKVPKRKIPTKKASPKKVAKKHDVDLSEVDYELGKVTDPKYQVTADTKYLLTLTMPDGRIYKIGLSDKPTPLDIKNFWEGMHKRK